jgi:Zn-dependent peptidase ImmA (M78 family)
LPINLVTNLAVTWKVLFPELLELDSSDSGSIQVEADQSFVIRIANHTSKTRDRFTIAHELGHFLLHFMLPHVKGEMKDCGLKAARYGSGQTEFEANSFAAALLMPKAVFAEQFNILCGDLVDVADFFGVSVSAATVRAKQLNLKN